MRVRRVGFRHGTDAELAAMHAVESEVEPELRPGRAARPLESYVAFARNLPSQFDDHTWLAETDDGTPVGCSACWTDSAGDPEVMECYVYVRPRWREQGAGRLLAAEVAEAAALEQRSRLVWSTYDTVPAGAAFSQGVGGTVARVNRLSELRVDDVDWNKVQSWIDDCPGRAAGYRLDFWAGPLPADLLDDAVTFHRIMQTAPRDDLEVGDVALAPTNVAEIERALAESGQEHWTIFVRAPDGACVGGTEVMLEPWDPRVAQQQNTAIDPPHRGLGLAKWAKASMLARVRADRPMVERVHTGNAFTNAPMLAINDALGFAVSEVRTEWQGSVRQLHATLCR